MRRVVITGMGMVAPCGKTVGEAWNAVLHCKSGVGPVTHFDASAFPVRIGAEVKGFSAEELLGPKDAKRTSRFTQLAATAAQQAFDDAGLDALARTDRCGCIVGVGLGSTGDIEEQCNVLRDRGPTKVTPMLMPVCIPNMAAGYVSVRHRLRGVCFGVASACASGAHAIGQAYDHIVANRADVVLTGGAEAVNTPLAFAAFASLGALSKRNDSPAEASRPFDLDRDGFVIGEGAAILVVEELEHARRRGAQIYAEMCGYGLSADGFHITSPSPEGEGASRAMAGAMRAARIDRADVDYINAHGTSTKANDVAESAAIEVVFGSHARRLAVSSTKGVTGHCLGAAGAIEAIFSILAITNGTVPPTANYRTPDPACRLNYTPREPRQRPIRFALSNSFGFGGQNACLAFSRFDG